MNYKNLKRIENTLPKGSLIVSAKIVDRVRDGFRLKGKQDIEVIYNIGDGTYRMYMSTHIIGKTKGE